MTRKSRYEINIAQKNEHSAAAFEKKHSTASASEGNSAEPQESNSN